MANEAIQIGGAFVGTQEIEGGPALAVAVCAGTVATSGTASITGAVTVSGTAAISGAVTVSGTPTVAPTYVPTSVAFYNVAIASADTQYAQALPALCKGLVFRCREATSVRYAFVPDIVASGTVSPFSTLGSGAEWSVMPMLLTNGTAYFASGSAGIVVEMEAWA